MDIFQKIHNYEVQQFLLSQLNKNAPLPITKIEKSWLKEMINRSDAVNYLTSETLGKLSEVLSHIDSLDSDCYVEEKRMIKSIYSATRYYRTLRDAILTQSCISIDYRLNDGEIRSEDIGIPWRLEFSLTRNEWYLLWCRDAEAVAMTVTPFRNITAVNSVIPHENYVERIQQLADVVHKSKKELQFFIQHQYNKERHRIFRIFSCFEKNINYDKEIDTYSMNVYYFVDDESYLIAKLRMLGKKVTVTGPADLLEVYISKVKAALDRYIE